MSEAHSVIVHFDGKTETVTVPDDKTVLQAAEDAGLSLPASCYAGVCTTCAVRVISGEIDQSEGAGISPEVQEKGYSLICIGYAKSDMEIEAGKEDEVYDMQFGK